MKATIVTDPLPAGAAYADQPRVDAILDAFGSKSYRSISLLTYLVWGIARRDRQLSLEPAFHKNRSNQTALNDALNERLGVKLRRRSADKEFLTHADCARRFFADRPAARTNYAHQLKRAARLAAGLIDLDATVVRLPDGGLEISAGNVEQVFKMTHVRLTEKATPGQSTPISFVDVEIYARTLRDQPLARHSNTRGRLAKLKTPELVDTVCHSLQVALSRTPTLTEAQRLRLQELRKAITHALA